MHVQYITCAMAPSFPGWFPTPPLLLPPLCMNCIFQTYGWRLCRMKGLQLSELFLQCLDAGLGHPECQCSPSLKTLPPGEYYSVAFCLHAHLLLFLGTWKDRLLCLLTLYFSSYKSFRSWSRILTYYQLAPLECRLYDTMFSCSLHRGFLMVSQPYVHFTKRLSRWLSWWI